MSEPQKNNQTITAPTNMVIDGERYPKLRELIEAEANELNKDRIVPYGTASEFIVDVLNQYFQKKIAEKK